mmetsp:Transcript_32392/g.84977  ORF Transcript_32392/g.84977 Transcript_32392/m.84977 type:complete len:300 (-) Transcript_32392:255-1154(-)
MHCVAPHKARASSRADATVLGGRVSSVEGGFVTLGAGSTAHAHPFDGLGIHPVVEFAIWAFAAERQRRLPHPLYELLLAPLLLLDLLCRLHDSHRHHPLLPEDLQLALVTCQVCEYHVDKLAKLLIIAVQFEALEQVTHCEVRRRRLGTAQVDEAAESLVTACVVICLRRELLAEEIDRIVPDQQCGVLVACHEVLQDRKRLDADRLRCVAEQITRQLLHELAAHDVGTRRREEREILQKAESSSEQLLVALEGRSRQLHTLPLPDHLARRLVHGCVHQGLQRRKQQRAEVDGRLLVLR